MQARSTGGEWPRTRRVARRASALFLGGCLGLSTLALAGAARADEQQAFELAKNPFDAGQFAEAHLRLSALLDPALPLCEAQSSGRCRVADADLVERARALDAASLLALKREAEADALIAKILRQNPQYVPNAALFPQEVVDRFTVVRGQLRPELEAIAQQRAREELTRRMAGQKQRDAEEKWISELERLAGQETRVVPNSRWIAMVPFGVGQFQNGDTRLGVVFAAGEVILGAAALVTVAIVNKLAVDLFDPTLSIDKNATNARIRTVTVVNQITFAAWAAVTVAGIVQAQVGFVPEHSTTQARPVPPRPKVGPLAAPVPGGAVFGLAGTF